MEQPVLHLVYPHGSSIACPDAIGRNLAKRLGETHDVILHDWDERATIRPGTNAFLLGHPHPDPRTVFRRSCLQPGWRRAVMMCPYAHNDPRQVAMWDTVLPHCDWHLAITGPYWIETMKDSLFAHWQPRTRHLDLAVDRKDFPVVKTRFNPPGQRKFLYIGSTAWMKNTAYLSRIARLLPGAAFGWAGGGRGRINGFKRLGRMDFASPEARRAIAEYDFMVTAGFSDANPATILESMAWGLLPVCTPQSGYAGIPSIPSIPLGNAEEAARILRHLQAAAEADLIEMQRRNFALLDSHYNWARFARDVDEALRTDGRRPLGPLPAARRLRIRIAALTSPYVPWHPGRIARSTLRLLRS